MINHTRGHLPLLRSRLDYEICEISDRQEHSVYSKRLYVFDSSRPTATLHIMICVLARREHHTSPTKTDSLTLVFVDVGYQSRVQI